jgi:hypothetical protein
MRYASFNALAADGGKIDISVVTFPGDGGSDADNINRWRGQMGLAPLDATGVNSQIAPLKTADTTFSTIDISSDKTRTIAAWTRRDGRVWFFKATGPGAAVEKQQPNFVKFDFRRHVASNHRHLYIVKADDRLSCSGDGADLCRHAGAGSSRDP